MKKTLFLFTLLLSVYASAQNIYSIADLPAVLLNQSNSIIRQHDIHLEVKTYDDIIISENKVVTVLNKKGLSGTDIVEFYDKSTSIKTLKVTVFDAFGNEITSFKERDFNDVSAVGSASLYQDDRVKYLEYIPTRYPVTIRLEKKIRSSNTAFIRSFNPYVNYYQAIQSYTFQIENNSGVQLRSSENEFVKSSVIKKETPSSLLYKVSNLPAIPREAYSSSLETFTPKVMFALSKFELEGEVGEISDWKEFGRWQYENLLEGLDELPESTIDKVRALTQNLSTIEQKARAIYQYVQDQMRYISVQIGLGGWKPISAQEVDEKKYGDCKGLTNYTKALLSIVGIDSNYCVVSAGSEIKDISEDFPSMQGNHVILNIPQDGKSDIWLECTSQDIPFNFLGTFTDDRNVFAVKPSGGEIIRTPSYTEKDNHQFTKASISILNKSIKASVEIITKGTQYNSHYWLEYKDSKEVYKYYRSYWDNLKELNLLSYKFDNKKKEIAFKEQVELEAENYVKIYGNDVILDINPFNKFQVNLPDYKERKTPFKVERGFVDEDEFTFELDQLKINVELEDVEVITKFGIYKLTFKMNEDKLVVKRYFKLNKSAYEVSDYSYFIEFFKEISRNDSKKISLKLT